MNINIDKLRNICENIEKIHIKKENLGNGIVSSIRENILNLQETNLGKQWTKLTGTSFPMIGETKFDTNLKATRYTKQGYLNAYFNSFKELKIEIENVNEYKEIGFGKVVSNEEVLKDKEKYFDIFSEGSKELKELLYKIYDFGLSTKACCSGHDEPLYEYYKDGIVRKTITAEEYSEHMNNRRYKAIANPMRAYIHIKTDNIPYLKAKQLNDMLKDSLSDIANCSIQDYVITIVAKRGGRNNKLFKEINEVFDKFIEKDNEKITNQPDVFQKDNLDEIILEKEQEKDIQNKNHINNIRKDVNDLIK